MFAITSTFLLAACSLWYIACDTSPSTHQILQKRSDLGGQKITKRLCDTKSKSGPGGAVYIRWGHNQCEGSETRMVYRGYVAGSYYNHPGGSANSLCLPNNPTTFPNKYKHHAYVYGTEYEMIKTDGKVQAINHHDIPCAVCQSTVRSNSIMLPGRNICPYGWKREYTGLLMAGYPSHKSATQYICIDNDMKTVHGGKEYKSGKFFYPVVTQCGSLKCPPYRQNEILPCVVCTN